MNYMLNFEMEFKQFCLEHKLQIDQLSVTIGDRVPELDDFFWEQLSELKGYLASNAANTCTSDEAQDNAIIEAEEWVTDNLSGKGLASDIAVVFWLNGTIDGTLLIRTELGLDIVTLS